LALQRSFHRTLDLLRNSVVAYESLASGPLGSTPGIDRVRRAMFAVCMPGGAGVGS